MSWRGKEYTIKKSSSDNLFYINSTSGGVRAPMTKTGYLSFTEAERTLVAHLKRTDRKPPFNRAIYPGWEKEYRTFPPKKYLEEKARAESNSK